MASTALQENTLNLSQAAAFLHVHEQTLLKLARAGNVPAAKVGRAWVFIDVDLLAYIRGKYRPQVVQGDLKGNLSCRSTNEKIHKSTGLSSQSVDKLYKEALGLQ
jgi:excisionase family DNA binding protein